MARSRFNLKGLKKRPLIAALLLLVAIAFVAAATFYMRMDRIVTRQFEGRRWTLPAQVYAAPLELYAGLELPAAQLERELQRLQYRSAERLARPGLYRRRGSRIDVALRAARFANETRPAQILTINASGGSIKSLRDSGGKEQPIVALDPALIGSIFPTHGEDRIVVLPNEVPDLLPQALKAVEDRKFDTHHGVDPMAILRALWVNVRAGQVEQGGSTLTQQLVKSYFLDPRQTLGRKLREAVMAIALDARFPKADLMNAYINEIYLGQDGRRAVHGFGLASQFYFGKPLAELDLAEIATLVTIARGPSYYDPRRNPDRVLKRRDLVLSVLAQQRIVSEEAAREARTEPLGVKARSAAGYFPAYLDFVRRTLRRDYREEDLTESGLRIFTSLDPRVQEEGEATLERELTRLDKLRKEKGATLEGSIVVTAPQSGDVIAIVGGRRSGYDGFNRALDARRPIGSLVKPFVYLTALETGKYNATTLVDDMPVEIRIARGKVWRPVNFKREFYGPVPLVRALAESLNLATVNLGIQVGVPEVAQTIERFGLGRRPHHEPALLLGALDATPLEVSQLYNGLANGGFRTQLRAVRAVVSADGKPLKAFPLKVSAVADADAVYQVNRMLEQVMLKGTGRAAKAALPSSLVVAGKSGTSSDQRDSWFAGFSGSHLAVVWVGYDDNRPTRLTGSSGALAIWSRLMAQLNTTSWSAFPSESLTEVQVEFTSGLRADPNCGVEVISIAVPVGSEPPVRPGCESSAVENVLERAGEWLRGIIKQ